MNKKILLLSIFFFTLIFLPKPSYAWWNSNWMFKRNITINNTANSNTLTDYQVAINLTYDSDMQPDFSDIRFTFYNSTSGTETEIPYWIESKVNSAWAYVWVKVPYIPASSYATIYVYYKNSTVVSSASNGRNTFIVFDDFESSLDTNYWNVSYYSGNTISVENGELGLRCYPHSYCLIYKVIPSSNNLILEFRWKVSSTDGTVIGASWGPKGVFWFNAYDWAGSPWSANSKLGMHWVKSGSESSGDFGPAVINQWYDVRVIYNSTNYVYAYAKNSTMPYTLLNYTYGSEWTSANAIIIGKGYEASSYPNPYLQNTYSSPGSLPSSKNIWFDNVKVRKFTLKEPTYSIGEEEILPNQPPTITIYSPLNQTYFKSYIEISGKAVDDQNTFYFAILLNGENSYLYENETYQSNTLINLTVSLPSGTYWVKFVANDGYNQTSQTIYFTIKDYEVSQVSYQTNVYETSNQNFTIVLRYNPDLVQNITSKLIWNETDYGYNEYQVKNSTHITNTKQITIPLIITNNTQIQFKFENKIKYNNNYEYSENTTSYNQNVLFAYWIQQITSDKTNYLEGEKLIAKLFVVDLIRNAELRASFNLLNESKEKISYETLDNVKIFNQSFYVYPTETQNLSRTLNVTLFVSFQNRTRIMNSSNVNIYVFYPFLTVCDSTFSTKTLELRINDEENYNLINGSIDFMGTVRSIYGDIKRQYSFEFRNNNTYSLCLYPTWAILKIDSIIQYWANNYPDRNYFLQNATLTNTTSQLDLYLLPSDLATPISIYVKTSEEAPVENVIVKIRRFYIGKNSYITVAMTKTDWEGKGLTYLRINEIWYSFILEKDGDILREYPPTIIHCTSSPCSLTLYTSQQESATYFKVFGKIKYYCEINDEEKKVRCEVTDPTNLMTKNTLSLEKRSPFSWEKVCESDGYSSSNILVCDLDNNTTGIYFYNLIAEVGNLKYNLESDYLDWGQAIIWGSAGLLLTFLIAGTLAFVGVANPVVSIVLAIAGILVGYALGMMVVSIGALVGLIIGMIFLVYKMRS
ncbi:MAG: DUF2341 domain-containing protein [Candidatus Aenigmatarchaeota archaeon]